MSLRLPRTCLLLAGFCGGWGLTAADDSFLQKSVPSFLMEAKTYGDGVEELSRVIGKPVTVPEGVVDFVKEINSWKLNYEVPVWMLNGDPKKAVTLRAVLDRTSTSLGMNWRYDQGTDRVNLDFQWLREDTRTGEELVRVLQETTASVAHEDLRYYWEHRSLSPHETWQIAFDALLSKQGNRDSVWKLRLADDLKRSIVPSPVLGMLSAKIKDQDGKDHLLVLTDQPAMMNPGEGSFCYYVFDLHGRFEQGGLYGSGWRCHEASAWIDPNGKQLTVRVFFNYAEKMDQHFLLTEKGLVLQEVVNDRMETIPASDGELAGGYHMGQSPFRVTR